MSFSISYKSHPWVFSLYFKVLDENHVRVYIDLSAKGKYAEIFNWDEEDKLLYLYKDRDECLICEDDLTISLQGSWSLVESYSGRYTIFFLLVRTDFKNQSEEYWAKATEI